MEITRPWPDAQIERRHGLEIMIEYIGPRLDDLLESAILAQEIGRQHLYGGRWRCPSNGPDHLREMLRATVIEIVAVDRGDHRVRKAHPGDRIGDLFRLSGIEGF